jgi:hypothetical protein
MEMPYNVDVIFATTPLTTLPHSVSRAEKTMASNRTEKTKYLHLYQSFGGVYKMPHQTEEGEIFHALGSTGCRTCVCVFVELSDNTCFAAHISAYNGDAGPDSGGVRVDLRRLTYVPDNDMAQSLIDHTVKTLSETPGLSEQVSGGRFTGKIDRGLILCPQQFWGGELATGSFIIKGLEQFFGVKMVQERGHGFIANSSAGLWNVQIVGWKDGYAGPKEIEAMFYDYKKHDEQPEDCGWMCANSAPRGEHVAGGWAFVYRKASPGWSTREIMPGHPEGW